MKYFITFSLLFLTNCLAPSAISATIHAKNNQSNSSINVNKKCGFKKPLILKLSKKKVAKIKRITDFFLTAAVLILLGILLLISANKKTYSNPPTANVYNFPDLTGVVERSLGILFIIGGSIMLILGIEKRKNQPKLSLNS